MLNTVDDDDDDCWTVITSAIVVEISWRQADFFLVDVGLCTTTRLIEHAASDYPTTGRKLHHVPNSI